MLTMLVLNMYCSLWEIQRRPKKAPKMREKSKRPTTYLCNLSLLPSSYSFSRLARPSKITTLLLPANASDSYQAFLASEQLSPVFSPFPSERCGLSRLQRVYTHTQPSLTQGLPSGSLGGPAFQAVSDDMSSRGGFSIASGK